jgi:hypothetical protein
MRRAHHETRQSIGLAIGFGGVAGAGPERRVKDKCSVLVVPSGALTALPFHPAVWGPFALIGEGAAR